ncbi:MAG TPA: DinB family protein [Acidobacteriaceae bacterium]|jgi:hypothetical protein|nr:DinB family protein [Acidobacteriaceae bacterium]
MKNPYAKYLGGRDPLAVMAATPGALYNLLSPLLANAADGHVNQQPAPGKWSIREILVHLADCEIAVGFRMRQSLAETDHVMQPFDQELWAERYAAYDAPTALATFVALRNWNMLFLKTVQPQDLGRVVSHPERGTGSFRILLETIGGHDLNHLQQMERLVQAGPAT